MRLPERIALIGRDDRGLGPRVLAVLEDAVLSRFPDPFVDFEAIRKFRPDLALVLGESLDLEAFGVLRLVRHSLGSLRILLALDERSRVEHAAPAGRLGAQILTLPADDVQLARALRGPEAGASDARDEAERIFFELCRSLSDEVNNPLLFVDGHLALLEAQLDPNLTQDTKDLLTSARGGLQRIGRAVDAIRFAADAHPRRNPRAPVPMSELVQDALRRSPEDVRATVLPPSGAEANRHPVAVDRRLAVDTLLRLLSVVSDLSDAEATVTTHLSVRSEHVILRALLPSSRLTLPAEPQPVRPLLAQGTLRGSPIALRLSVVDLALRRQSGRLELSGDGGALRIDASLPLATHERSAAE